MRHIVMAGAVLAAVAGSGIARASGQAASQPAIEDQLVNVPSVAALSVNGTATSRQRADKAVQGGKALRIAVPAADQQSWKASLSTAITKPVKRGDRLVVAFYARAEQPPEGATAIDLPFNGVQLAKEPYTPVLHEGVSAGPEWKLQHVAGTADRDYAAGELMVSIHLATGKQVIDVGPIFVLDLGPKP